MEDNRDCAPSAVKGTKTIFITAGNGPSLKILFSSARGRRRLLGAECIHREKPHPKTGGFQGAARPAGRLFFSPKKQNIKNCDLKARRGPQKIFTYWQT